jgi:hypothetical protein
VLAWRASFVHGIQTADIAFTQFGQLAKVFAKEELAGKPYGQPYHAQIRGACASLYRSTSDKEFTVQSSAAGRCRIVVTDSLEHANSKDLLVYVSSSPRPRE